MQTDAWGIDEGYHSVDGTWHPVPLETRQELRAAMGGLRDVDDPPPPGLPVWFVRQGEAHSIFRPAELVLEDGTHVHAEAALPPDLPLGYHDLHPDDGGPTTRLIVHPTACHLPDDLRTWGWSVQLYAARSAQSWGMGDLGDLATLAAWSASLGAGVLAHNPLHAPLPTPHQQASPYFPSSRRWRSPLYLRVEDVAGFTTDDPVLADAAAAGRRLNSLELIDRDRIHRLKMDALGWLWSAAGRDRGPHDQEFRAWAAAQGTDLRRFAIFCALAEAHGVGWRQWAPEYRRPDSAGVARFAAEHADRVRFHEWLQFLLDKQLRSAASHIGLFGDLAVGVDPDGADGWTHQDVLAAGVRVGAPPDDFSPEGQDWGLPPFVPWKLRSARYEPFINVLRAGLTHCRALRIDHVMGLFRLYWIPEGAPARDGAYVRLPGSELPDLVALESVRAGVVVAGEDLGTVEAGVREQLLGRKVLSYRVTWFEDTEPERWPADTLATLTTHDLPTVAGVWDRTDGEPVLRDRLEHFAEVDSDASATAVNWAAHDRLGRSPSRIALAALEDALGVRERTNVPGTTTERPNWSQPLPKTVADLVVDPEVTAIAARMGATRPPKD